MYLLKESYQAVSAGDLLRRLLFSILKNPTKQTTENDFPSTPSQWWFSHETNGTSLPIYLAGSHIWHCSTAGSTKCPHAPCHLQSHRSLKYFREEEKFQEVKCQKGRKATNCKIRFFQYKATTLGWPRWFYQWCSDYGLLWWQCPAGPSQVCCLGLGSSRNTPVVQLPDNFHN